MSWGKKRVLVTGAGGFIGSHLTEKLIELGADVTAFVKYNSRNHWGFLEDFDDFAKEKLNLFAGDMKDPDAVRSAMKDIDLVFHLGANIAIPYSYLCPRDHVETNVIGTLNVLTAARDAGVSRFIHTSTSEVYGSAQYTPIDEKHPLQGQSPYSASKIGADKVAESFYLSYELPVSTVRPFNTYGPRQSARAVIPTIITQALAQKEVKLGALTPTRDFTFVSDTVDAFIKAAESNNSVGQTVNIGSGFEISIKELAEKIITLTGNDCSIVSDEQRTRPKGSEVDRLLADNKKAKALFGWEPKVDFETGLKQTIDYIKNNIDSYKVSRYNV